VTIGVDPLLTYLKWKFNSEIWCQSVSVHLLTYWETTRTEVVVKRRIWKKWLLTVGNLKDDEWEGVYLSILKWILWLHRLRLYGEATAVVMNFDEICRFVKFAIFCVLIVLMEFVAEISTSHLKLDSTQWLGFIHRIPISGDCYQDFKSLSDTSNVVCEIRLQYINYIRYINIMDTFHSRPIHCQNQSHIRLICDWFWQWIGREWNVSIILMYLM